MALFDLNAGRWEGGAFRVPFFPREGIFQCFLFRCRGELLVGSITCSCAFSVVLDSVVASSFAVDQKKKWNKKENYRQARSCWEGTFGPRARTRAPVSSFSSLVVCVPVVFVSSRTFGSSGRIKNLSMNQFNLSSLAICTIALFYEASVFSPAAGCDRISSKQRV